MSVNLADLPRLPFVVPALKLLFTDREAEAEEDGEGGGGDAADEEAQ